MNFKGYTIIVKIFLTVFLIMILKRLNGQTSNIDLDYTRKGITPVFIMPEFTDYPDEFDSPDEAFQAALKQMELPEKVDDNRIKNGIVIDKDLSHSVPFQLGKGFSDDYVRKVIEDKNVVRQVIDTIFDAGQKGRYSMEELINRVKYDLNDAEVRSLKSTAKGFDQGARDVQWINKILKSNYIFAFRFKFIKSYETIRKQGGNANLRIEEDQKGYKAKGHVFIYRIDMNDTIRHKFFSKCWAGKNSSKNELQKALKARDNFDFEYEYLDQCQFGNTKQQEGFKKSFAKDTLTKKEKFLQIPELSFYSGKYCLENTVNLTGETNRFDQVKASLYKTSYFPYFYGYSKIGTKEGVDQDDRFYVYENVLVDGEKKQKLRGVLRATNDITENDTVSSGNIEPTKFVQTYGKPLGKGMLIRQKNGGVASLSLGWLYHGRNYFNGQWEIRLSKWLDFTNGFYFYQDFGYAFESFSGDEDIYHTEIGLSQMLYVMRDIHLSPYAGLKVLPNFTYDLGLRIDLNLSQWLKLRTSLGYAPVDYSKNKGRERLMKNLNTSFPNKWSVMLRAKF